LQLLFLLTITASSRAGENVPAQIPVINSISVSGTNLVITASIPSGASQVVLEICPTLADSWQEAAAFQAPTNGGPMEFSIPQPPLPMAFFRLNVSLAGSAQPQLSTVVHYQIVPPLTEVATNGSTEAVFHFNGEIDGSDKITIRRDGALWEHVSWGWPGTVIVNDSQWQPSEKNFLTSTGAVSFLPPQYSLSAADLEVVQGRDVVAVERTNDALIVYLDDTPLGAAPYEFKVHFHPATQELHGLASSTAATLKIAAHIDGSDRLRITTNEATWTHLTFSPPGDIRLNNVSWDLGQTNVLSNTGTNSFLPSGIDFSTAKILARKGRDLATMQIEKDGICVSFADNPNGGDDYELDVSFGQ